MVAAVDCNGWVKVLDVLHEHGRRTARWGGLSLSCDSLTKPNFPFQDDLGLIISKIKRLDAQIVKRNTFIAEMISQGLHKYGQEIFRKIFDELEVYQRKKSHQAGQLNAKIVESYAKFEASLAMDTKQTIAATSRCWPPDNLSVLANCAFLSEKLTLRKNLDISGLLEQTPNSPVKSQDNTIIDESKPKKKRGRKPKIISQQTELELAVEQSSDEPVSPPVKKRRPTKSDSEDDTEEPLYCLCNRPSFGSMIECSNEHCTFEWFHFSCVGLKKRAPKGKWWVEVNNGNLIEFLIEFLF